MYPYLWLRLRKAFKGAWNRYNSSKRERTTSFSSLQECLDHQPARSSLWRNWYLLLLIAPLVYYVTLICIIWEDRPVVITALRSLQQVTENTTETSSSKNDLENTITPQVGTKTWCDYKPDAIPLSKLEVKINNVTTSQWYRQMVHRGGSFSPSFCESRHKVAIIVPYRDRPSNLAVFLLTIHPFLIDQIIEYRIFVVEQSGKDLFNKGRLFNAGFAEAMKLGHWNCLIFHDVDLLPTSKLILYTCPLWPRHMCPTLVENGKAVWNFHSYFGGVAAMSVKHFKCVNGFSNLYWGWGGEDTDMFWRIRGAGLIVGRYQKDVAKYLTLPHKKGPECVNRYELIKTAVGRYPYDGLTTLKYRVVSMKLLHLYTHILVDINPTTTDEATIASPHNVSVKRVFI